MAGRMGWGWGRSGRKLMEQDSSSCDGGVGWGYGWEGGITGVQYVSVQSLNTFVRNQLSV